MAGRKLRFTRAREPIDIELGGESFTAPPIMPPTVLGELLDTVDDLAAIQADKNLSQRAMLDKMIDILGATYGLILVPESAERFNARLRSRDNPFDLIGELMPGLEGLIEEYTDRPTQPSPPSTTGSSDGGTTGPDGVLLGVSTPSTSTPDDSSTSPIT